MFRLIFSVVVLHTYCCFGFVVDLPSRRAFGKAPASRPDLRLWAAPARSSTAKRARDLVRCLIEEDKCYSTERGARAFADACAANVIIADCFFPQPFNGKSESLSYMLSRVAMRKGKGDVRIDKISDGDKACGFAWTWTSGSLEGLRGTTFVELNDNGEIVYLQEIPEPLFKPGDLTKQLLEALTKGAVRKPPVLYTKKQPTRACEVAKYLFLDLNNADPVEATDELMTFFDSNVVYRDFNYKDVLRGPVEVRKFVQDFSFPGIEFRPIRFDDGDVSTCFTWEVAIDDAPDTIKGISFYELDPVSRKIVYVRDVPESAIKPPLLGTWARDIRPGVGVFDPVPIGSRAGGM